jgi:hypothetical protein
MEGRAGIHVAHLFFEGNHVVERDDLVETAGLYDSAKRGVCHPEAH